MDSLKKDHKEFIKTKKINIESIKLKGITYLLKELVRLLQVQIMI